MHTHMHTLTHTHTQVGPAMLVLGDEAQRNGLAFSLLDRLYQHYRGIGGAADSYSATLITNYRCHQGIVKLSEKLFYGIPLECAVPADTTHPDAPFPLAFVCSSVDDRSQIENAHGYYENEASIAVEEVDRYTDVRKWPHQWGERDMSQFCLISPTRYQVYNLISIHCFCYYRISWYLCVTSLTDIV